MDFCRFGLKPCEKGADAAWPRLPQEDAIRLILLIDRRWRAGTSSAFAIFLDMGVREPRVRLEARDDPTLSHFRHVLDGPDWTGWMTESAIRQYITDLFHVGHWLPARTARPTTGLAESPNRCADKSGTASVAAPESVMPRLGPSLSLQLLYSNALCDGANEHRIRLDLGHSPRRTSWAAGFARLTCHRRRRESGPWMSGARDCIIKWLYLDLVTGAQSLASQTKPRPRAAKVYSGRGTTCLHVLFPVYPSYYSGSGVPFQLCWVKV